MQSESKITEYLEKKYQERFAVEGVKEGSSLYPEMYGKDKIFAYPEGKPEMVFLAGESKKQDGEFYDRYPLAIWSSQLDETFRTGVEEGFGKGTEFKTLLYIEGSKYNGGMIHMDFQDYFENVNNEALITLNIGVKTAGEPEIEKYAEAIFKLMQQLKELNVKNYGVTVGFVDESEDISEYIRTSNVNNIAWSNLDAKVYGTIMVDNTMEIHSPSKLKQFYQQIEG
ncbi:hypothetical protein [Mesobacillus foraminis]|uniref:hypothetical protein n=1 Tax=Mesobacillus foraminis TaxID=279826 RepID=UPI000EF522D6|nr:hypothetical protein [Mesobacillus foraminis]